MGVIKAVIICMVFLLIAYGLAVCVGVFGAVAHATYLEVTHYICNHNFKC